METLNQPLVDNLADNDALARSATRQSFSLKCTTLSFDNSSSWMEVNTSSEATSSTTDANLRQELRWKLEDDRRGVSAGYPLHITESGAEVAS